MLGPTPPIFANPLDSFQDSLHESASGSKSADACGFQRFLTIQIRGLSGNGKKSRTEIFFGFFSEKKRPRQPRALGLFYMR